MHAHTHTHTHSRTHPHTHTRTHIHTHMHTPTHTRTHAPTRWRFTEWCSFDYKAAFPVWNLTDVALCELELYDHGNDTGVGVSALDDFDNVNLAYLPGYEATVRELHTQLVLGWDGGKRPPGGTPHPPPPGPPGPEPAPPQPPKGKPGFLTHTNATTGQRLCLTAGSESVCRLADCNPLSLAPCTSSSSVWQQTANGVELLSNSTSGQCLNLYGGGKPGTCPSGTAVHLHECGWLAAKGDRFQLTGDGVGGGQLQFDTTAGDECGGLCVVPSEGCPVVASCAESGAASTGWAIDPAGGSWE
jgi:hypothetical protein